MIRGKFLIVNVECNRSWSCFWYFSTKVQWIRGVLISKSIVVKSVDQTNLHLTLIFLYGFANPFLNERKKKSRVEVKGGEGEINQLFQTKLFSHFPFFKSWSICKTLRHSFAHNQWAKRVPGILKHTFQNKNIRSKSNYCYHFETNLVIFHTAFRFNSWVA